jgi:gluconate 2-dehydrogenase alpha chain
MRSFRILTPYETELADALFEAMFPSDGESPDVRDAGVTEYLDLTLEGYGRKDLPKYQWLFGALDRYAEGKHGRNFASLALEERTDVLALLEQGELTDQLPVKDQRDLFGLVVAHTQEGLFADPAHGGNKDAVGWKFLKHPGVWLENSAEENLSPQHVTKGGVIKTLADAMQEIPRDTEGHKLKQLGYENAVNPQMTDEVDVLLVGVGAMGGLSA